jgi:hypothetical protein
MSGVVGPPPTPSAFAGGEVGFDDGSVGRLVVGGSKGAVGSTLGILWGFLGSDGAGFVAANTDGSLPDEGDRGVAGSVDRDRGGGAAAPGGPLRRGRSSA